MKTAQEYLLAVGMKEATGSNFIFAETVLRVDFIEDSGAVKIEFKDRYDKRQCVALPLLEVRDFIAELTEALGKAAKYFGDGI